MTFPVIQSVLDTAALAKALVAIYGPMAPVQCRLISRGMNDIYHVTAGAQRFALKVARAGRSDAEFAYEPAYVAHLDRAGFIVPTPVMTLKGAPFFTVDAPEGPRQVVLMRWLEGAVLTKTASEDQARQLGAWLARIHQAGVGYAPPMRRAVAGENKMQERLPLLLDMVGNDPPMRDFLQRAADTVRARLAALDPRLVPRGPCHGDFQYANIMIGPDRAIGVFDFSDCGEDFFARDLAAFFWRADFDGVGEQLNPAFVAGYASTRPLNPAELAALPLFRAARHFVITMAMANYVNRIGPIAGFDGNLRYYLSMIRLYCAEAGIN